jgi:hypothetical protein
MAPINISGADSNHNILTLCTGDANGSYDPGSNLKLATNIFSADSKERAIYSASEIRVPFTLGKAVKQLSSVTLMFSYPEELFDVSGVEMAQCNEDLFYTVYEGVIRVVYSTLRAYDLDEGDLLMTIRLGLKKEKIDMVPESEQITFSGYGEFGDYNGHVLEGVTLKYGLLENTMTTVLNENRKIMVYPNPASDRLIIRNAEGADLTMFDVLGRSVLTMKNLTGPQNIDVSRLVTGTYTLKIQSNNDLICKKIVISR